MTLRVVFISARDESAAEVLRSNFHFYLVFVFSSGESLETLQTGSQYGLIHTPAKSFLPAMYLALFVLLLRDNELWNNSHLKKEKINGFEFAFLFLLAPLSSFFHSPLSPACLLLKKPKKRGEKENYISTQSIFIILCFFPFERLFLAVRGLKTNNIGTACTINVSRRSIQ